MPGTGDIWSTAADVSRFTAALHARELIAYGSHRAEPGTHQGAGLRRFALCSPGAVVPACANGA